MGSKLLATRRRATRVDRRKKVEVEVERVTVDRGCSYHQPSSVAGDAVNVDCLADKAKQQLQRHIDILDEIQRIDIRWYRQAFGLSQEQFA